MERDVVELIRAHDAGRDPVRLAMRFQAMRASPFAFLRATCHLYYARAHEAGLLPEAPSAWLCGDLHLENFGSFRGANGLAYFDLNDFDEAVLAPGTWDILRLATSIMVWAKERNRSVADQRAHAKIAVDAFAEAMRGGGGGLGGARDGRGCGAEVVATGGGADPADVARGADGVARPVGRATPHPQSCARARRAEGRAQAGQRGNAALRCWS